MKTVFLASLLLLVPLRRRKLLLYTTEKKRRRSSITCKTHTRHDAYYLHTTPPVFPNTRTDMIYTSDGLIQVYGVDGALVYTSPITGGTVKIGAVSR